MNRPTLSIILFFSIGCFVSLFFMPSTALAASLFFSPSTINANAGDTVNVSVLVNTNLVSINDISTTINFPSDLLQVLSLSKSGSILSMWIDDPSFSNNSGTISFEGGIPTPGYTGLTGKVVDISFKVKKSGTASLSFSSVSVLANDGQGTELSQGSNKAIIQLGPASPITTTVPSKKTIAPTATKKTSASVITNDKDELSTVVIQPENPTIPVQANNNFIQSAGLSYSGQSSMFLYIISFITFIILIILLVAILISYYNRRRLSVLIDNIGKDVQNLKYSDTSKENELIKIRENVYTELDKKNNAFEKEIQQIRMENVVKDLQLATIKDSIEWKLNERSNSFDQTIQQMRIDNSDKRDLVQSLVNVQTNINMKLRLLKGSVDKLNKADTVKTSSISELKGKLENQLQSITDSFKKDIQQLRDFATIKEQDLLSMKSSIENRNALFEKGIQELKEADALIKNEMLEARDSLYSKLLEELKNLKDGIYVKFEEKIKNLSTLSEKNFLDTVKKQDFLLFQQEFFSFKGDMEKKLEERVREVSILFESDIQKIKEINEVKENELVHLKDRFSHTAALIDKLTAQVHNSAQSKEVSKIQEAMQAMLAEKIKDISALFKSDIQLINKLNATKENELAKLKDRLDSITSLLQKPAPKADNRVQEKELLKLQEAMQTMQAMLEEKIISLKKELKPVDKPDKTEKEIARLEARLEKKLQSGLGVKLLALEKEISTFNDSNANNLKQLSALEGKIGDKNEEKFEAKLKVIDNKLNSGLTLFDKRVSELSKIEVASKGKVLGLEAGIKKISDYYQKLDVEGEEIREQIERINSSLRAFYSNAMLSATAPVKKRK